MTAIVRPIFDHMSNSALLKKIYSMPTMKIGFYTGATALSILGFNRGSQEFYINELKKKKEIFLKDYACCCVFGVMGASIYINPAFSGFAIYHEYLRAKMMITGVNNKHISDSNMFFNLFFNLCSDDNT